MSNEKVVMLPWDFIELKCGYNHINENGKPYNPEMIIKEGSESAYYDCPDEHCINRIPPIVFEKLLEKVKELISDDKAIKGYVWKQKISRQNYEFEIFNYKSDKKITIGVKNLSIRKK